ncbi:glycoside hydrolase family 27 protein [Paenibacillus qinlingensis]|uniref:Alpha-galactosidase n=1 Tax=Paenibacillus qinlingensis TaxID=1837343 RepID=A0ABU1P2C9_9BACL|nr:glycoside hydrolase family 27 protein [Paenibacillus qinlingensis]MDR6553899.1 hypothetical protein [Paenibacillus qinlingensis]
MILSDKKLAQRTAAPPMGWNSYDSYGCSASERTLLPNLEMMAQRLKPFGYEYFVVDNGWFAEYELEPGQMYPRVKHAMDTRLDEYGRYIPSACYFPNGLQSIIDRTHELGLKFGIHFMRGISRKAVELNTPIKGTSYRARDIANTSDTCKWCHYNYGVDTKKPGAQEFYQSVVDQFAEWGVDFIKADDITGYPHEIEALLLAIERCGRPMLLSLSPGGQTVIENMDVYQGANLVRTTRDVWDNRHDLEQAFVAWEKYDSVRVSGFWLDLDMIPFGHLQLWNPRSNRSAEADDGNEELSGKGFERMSGLTRDQKYTFITIRALATSPLFMGGDLPTSDEFSFELITNRDMIDCNQNGIMGSLIYRENGIDIWMTPHKDLNGAGWLGIFNRMEKRKELRLPITRLGLTERHRDGTGLTDIWNDVPFAIKDGILEVTLPADGVLFLRYE